MQIRSPDQEANDASRGDAWRKRRQEALADAYAYDHGASFHEAFGRTDDGHDTDILLRLLEQAQEARAVVRAEVSAAHEGEQVDPWEEVES